MLITKLLINLIQIFCEIILNFQVIVKSIKDPDDYSREAFNLQIWPIQNDAKNLKND